MRKFDGHASRGGGFRAPVIAASALDQIFALHHRSNFSEETASIRFRASGGTRAQSLRNDRGSSGARRSASRTSRLAVRAGLIDHLAPPRLWMASTVVRIGIEIRIATFAQRIAAARNRWPRMRASSARPVQMPVMGPNTIQGMIRKAMTAVGLLKVRLRSVLRTTRSLSQPDAVYLL